MTGKTITQTVLLPHSVDTVWRALTEKELMSQWLMPTDFEPIPGRNFKLYGKPNRFWRGFVECRVLEIRRPELLVFSWQSVEAHPATEVRYELREHVEGSELRVTHGEFGPAHGAFSGLLIRTMIRIGLRAELHHKLPESLRRLDLQSPLQAREPLSR